MEKRSNPTAIKAGDRLSRISYVEVTEVDPQGKYLRLKNQEGLEWKITSDIVANEMYSASQYSETKKISRTELVEKLEGAGDTIFTVIFDKKASEKSVVDALYAQRNSLPSTKKALKSVAKNLLVGAERTLVGYLVNSEPKMGRSTVIDLEVPAGVHPLRLVDHRTIKSLILRNVRYDLKA